MKRNFAMLTLVLSLTPGLSSAQQETMPPHNMTTGTTARRCDHGYGNIIPSAALLRENAYDGKEWELLKHSPLRPLFGIWARDASFMVAGNTVVGFWVRQWRETEPDSLAYPTPGEWVHKWHYFHFISPYLVGTPALTTGIH